MNVNEKEDPFVVLCKKNYKKLNMLVLVNLVEHSA